MRGKTAGVISIIVVLGAIAFLAARDGGTPRSATTTTTTPTSDPAVNGDGTVRLSGTVVRVVDGDTIRVQARGFETAVRLLGIDTPETRAPGEPIECYGPQATRRAKELLDGKAVRLVGDPTQDTRDRYGRLLVYVYVGNAARSVNEILVEEGFARVYVYAPSGPFQQAEGFSAAEGRARAARRGLWGPACATSVN